MFFSLLFPSSLSVCLSSHLLSPLQSLWFVFACVCVRVCECAREPGAGRVSPHANGHQRLPTAANGRQRQPTAANGSQRQLTASNGRQRSPSSPRLPPATKSLLGGMKRRRAAGEGCRKVLERKRGERNQKETNKIKEDKN